MTPSISLRNHTADVAYWQQTGIPRMKRENWVDGRGNIQSVALCVTRLLIITVDKEKIDMKVKEYLDKIEESLFDSGQYQIILGTSLVNKIYDASPPLSPSFFTGADLDAPVKKEGNTFPRAALVFGEAFVPIGSALVATGLLMRLWGLLTQEAFWPCSSLAPSSIK